MKYESYWQDTAPAFSGSTPELNSGVYDVVVVGAGFSGLGAARNLAKEGCRVAVFDMGPIGNGGSGRNGGHLNNGLSHSFGVAEKKFGFERATKLYQAFDEGINTIERVIAEEKIDCDFRRGGKLKLASKRAHFDALARNQERLAQGPDPDTRLLSKQEVEKEVGSSIFYGGVLQPKSAAMHMGKYCVGLAEAAKGHGADIFEHSPVLGWSKKGSHWVVKTAKGNVTTKAIFLATNAYTPIKPFKFNWWRRRLVSMGSFIIATRPLSDDEVASIMPGNRGCVNSKNIGNYFRMAADNRLIFGGRARFSTTSNPASDTKSMVILKDAMTHIFPQLQGVQIDYCWGGLVGVTADRFPRAGEHNGIHYVMGYTGHGAQMSTHMGEVMSDIIMGKEDRNPFKDIPWPAIPGYWGYPWFLPVTGAYFRIKDKIS